MSYIILFILGVLVGLFVIFKDEIPDTWSGVLEKVRQMVVMMFSMPFIVSFFTFWLIVGTVWNLWTNDIFMGMGVPFWIGLVVQWIRHFFITTKKYITEKQYGGAIVYALVMSASIVVGWFVGGYGPWYWNQ